MAAFRAYRIFENKGLGQGQLVQMSQEELSPGNVVIQTHFSSVNYKDALAATGKAKILRHYPLNGGLDASGIVTESSDERFQPGDAVLVTGCGLGEKHDGGFSEKLRVPADWLIPLPSGLSLEEAMILGTAGFTAALCLFRMEMNEQTPEQGPILVTGASGGVGSWATHLFANNGYKVIAVSGKPERHDSLIALGAKEVLTPDELKLGTKPLESVRFGGAVDTVGGDLLSGLSRHVNFWGHVACVGMAGGTDLKTSVTPFILRGVSWLGISATNTPMAWRREVWRRLAGAWKPTNFSKVLSRRLKLEDLPDAFAEMLARRSHGRMLVDFT